MRDLNARGAAPVAIVLGSNEIGSAIAAGLHRAGLAVVLVDQADPAAFRRGMAFTDAWYTGSAELDGEAALFCSSVRSIPSVLDRHDAIAATTWSWPGIADALSPIALVDARMRREGPSLALRDKVGPGVRTVGVGPGFIAGTDVDVAIETAPGGRMGVILRTGQTLAHDGHVPRLGGAGRERFVYAVGAGRFTTAARIGDRVREGEVVGRVGRDAVVAPLGGVLRGLSSRGARIEPWTRIVEVDPRGEPVLCFGLAARARAIADAVVAVVAPSSSRHHRPAASEGFRATGHRDEHPL